MIEHRGPISGVAAGPNSWVATASYDNRLILWQHRSAIAVANHDHLVNQCVFSPCGTMLASASSDYTARLWSLPDLRLRAVFDGHDDDVEMASFDPKGQRVATASRDCVVRIFALDGRLLHELKGHDADVLSVSWCDEGRSLVSSGDDGTVKHWCSRDGTLIKTIDFGGIETDTVVGSPERILFAGNDHGEIIVIGSEEQRSYPVHDSGVKRLILDRHGTRLLSASYDGTFCLWQLRDNSLHLEHRSILPAIVWARSADFDETGRVIMGTFGSSFACYCPSKGVWDLDGVKDTGGNNALLLCNSAVYTVGDAGRVKRDGAELSALGSLCNFLCSWREKVVTGGHLGIVFDAQSGSQLYKHCCPINCAVALPGGDLVIGTYAGEGLFLRFCGGKATVAHVVQLHEQAVKGIAYAEGMLCSVSAAGDVTYYEIASQKVQTIKEAHTKIANGVTALLDGRFCSVSRDRFLRIWSGLHVEEHVTPHEHSVKCVATSQNGRYVATGSYDGSLAIFEVEISRFVVQFRPTIAGISSVTYGESPDDFLASTYDGSVYNFSPRLIKAVI